MFLISFHPITKMSYQDGLQVQNKHKLNSRIHFNYINIWACSAFEFGERNFEIGIKKDKSYE